LIRLHLFVRQVRFPESSDRPDGTPEVVVGDFDWLGREGTGTSLFVRGHEIGAGIAQVAAALWRRSGEDASADR
jgi:hypothetical protein